MFQLAIDMCEVFPVGLDAINQEFNADDFICGANSVAADRENISQTCGILSRYSFQASKVMFQ